CANATPAVALEAGCETMPSLRAEPTTSRKVPKFELVETLRNAAVPFTRRLPIANGVPAVGRTRTFCQVSEQAYPPLLALVTVKTNWVELTVSAPAVPPARPLML